MDSLIAQTMHIDDMAGDVNIDILVALVQDHEEQVETGHDWCGHGHIGFEAHLSVITPADRVSSRQNRGSSIEGGLNAGFGD